MFNKSFKAILLVTLLLLATVINAAQTVTYFHNDISGTPLVATDASGNVIWKENYYPYGERLKNQEGQQVASINNKLWFTGKPHDEDTGLSYFGARYYNPMLGRFMGIDPVDFNPDNIHSFNRYAYANNNPFKFIDPDGRNPLNIFDYYYFAKDVGNLLVKEIVYGIAIANGEYGVADQISQELRSGEAVTAAIESTIGLISFVPNTTQIIRAQRIAERAKNVVEPKRIYSARELMRRAENPRINNIPNPNHNFPESFNAEIFKGNKTIVRDNYYLYTKRGTLNGHSGVFEIGVRPSISGRTETITHRFFRPDK